MSKKLLILSFIIVFASCSRYSKHEIIEADAASNSREVLAYLEELIEDDGESYQVYFQRAKIYYELKDYQEALLDVQKSLELSPTDQESYLLLGQVYKEQGKTEESINAALQAEQRGFRNYELYKLLALNYLSLNEIDNAERSIDRLLEFNLTGENLSLKGDIYLELKDSVTAVKSYLEAIKLDRGLARPYLSLYSIHEKKNAAYAESFVDQYLEISPNSSNFLLLKANELRKREAYDSALALYLVADYQAFESPDLFNDVSNLYYKLTNYDTALLEAKKSLQLDSVKNREARLLVARSLDKLRQYEESKVYYEGLVQQDSTDIIATNELAILNRKVAYLWRLSQQEQAFDSLRNSTPPPVIRKSVNQ